MEAIICAYESNGKSNALKTKIYEIIHRKITEKLQLQQVFTLTTHSLTSFLNYLLE